MAQPLSAAAPPAVHRAGAAEWRARVDLAAFYRLVDHFGWTDLIYNHISARVPDAPDRYLVNAYSLLFSEITASNLLTVKLATGEVLGGGEEHAVYNEAAHVLHGAVLAARPDLACVAHVHTPAIMAVSAMTCGLLPITQAAMAFHGRLAFHDYGFDDAACERLANDMGDKDVVILRNHGVLLGARTIPEAFVRLHEFEFACRAQVQAMAGQAYLAAPPDAVLDAHARAVDRWLDRCHGPRDETRCLEWEACLRLLRRQDARYDV